MCRHMLSCSGQKEQKYTQVLFTVSYQFLENVNGIKGGNSHVYKVHAGA